jgi:CMP-N,N'-diacetyllegionaminic acid synthase
VNILYLIPARGGSQGLLKKNIRELNGKPLIYYTIDAARYVSIDDNICVSTDDDEIIKIVEEYGLSIPFVRPSSLATSFATTESVILHSLEYYRSIGRTYDFVVLLQPTSPLRTGQHISDALKIINSSTEMIVSVKETDANPYYILFEEDENGALQKSKTGIFTRRQDCPNVYELNGAIYIINVEKLLAHGISALQKEKYLMDKKSSIDIDDMLDFKYAEVILNS